MIVVQRVVTGGKSLQNLKETINNFFGLVMKSTAALPRVDSILKPSQELELVRSSI